MADIPQPRQRKSERTEGHRPKPKVLTCPHGVRLPVPNEGTIVQLPTAGHKGYKGQSMHPQEWVRSAYTWPIYAVSSPYLTWKHNSESWRGK